MKDYSNEYGTHNICFSANIFPQNVEVLYDSVEAELRMTYLCIVNERIGVSVAAWVERLKS